MSMDYFLPESLSWNLTESHKGKSASHSTIFFFSVHGWVAIGINLSLLSSHPYFCGHSVLTIIAFNSTCRPPENTTSALFLSISPSKADFHVASPIFISYNRPSCSNQKASHLIRKRGIKSKLELALIIFHVFICTIYLSDMTFLRHCSTKKIQVSTLCYVRSSVCEEQRQIWQGWHRKTS